MVFLILHPGTNHNKASCTRTYDRTCVLKCKTSATFLRVRHIQPPIYVNGCAHSWAGLHQRLPLHACTAFLPNRADFVPVSPPQTHAGPLWSCDCLEKVKKKNICFEIYFKLYAGKRRSAGRQLGGCIAFSYTSTHKSANISVNTPCRTEKCARAFQKTKTKTKKLPQQLIDTFILTQRGGLLCQTTHKQTGREGNLPLAVFDVSVSAAVI